MEHGQASQRSRTVRGPKQIYNEERGPIRDRLLADQTNANNTIAFYTQEFTRRHRSFQTQLIFKKK